MSVSYKKIMDLFNRKEYEKNLHNQAHRNYFKHLSQYGQRRIYIYEKLRKICKAMNMTPSDILEFVED